MSYTGLYNKIGTQVFLYGFCLGRGLYDDQIFTHIFWVLIGGEISNGATK
jgi:hypothetical protein